MARPSSGPPRGGKRRPLEYDERGFPKTPSVATARRRYREETKSRRARLELANKARRRAGGLTPIEVTRRLLDENSQEAEWTAEREKPVAYWDESWTFEPQGDADYGDLREWRWAMAQNRIVSDYLDDRVLSVIIDVREGRKMKTFTAAAGADYGRAMSELLAKLTAWAESYGREADEDEFSRIVRVTLLIRRNRLHKQWKTVTAGRAEARKAKEKRRRRA